MDDHEDILARYKRMRSASRVVNNALMEIYEPSIEEAAKALGVWSKGAIILDIEQMPVLMDHAIHNGSTRGRTVVERYVAEHPPEPGSDAQIVLAAMEKVFFSLFRVSGLVAGLGVRITDILRDQEHLLVDVNLSQSAVERMVIASRVIPFDDFIMTTGAALPVDVEVVEWVVEKLDRGGLSPEDMRELPREAWSQIETAVIGACLQYDGDQHVEYQDVPEGVLALSRDPGRVGRNDPCPCGSGRKFKKCCGR